MYYDHQGMDSWPKVDYKGSVLSLGFKNPKVIGLEYLKFKVESAEQIDQILENLKQKGARIVTVDVSFTVQP